jgi:curved DNA-binding protein CbpA
MRQAAVYHPTTTGSRGMRGIAGMLNSSAFKILGIEPTNDGHAIRRAYLRLARIYHPDRFAGLPDDVRVEAERRMKEATAAYEELRSAKLDAADPARSAVPADRWERAKRARDAVEKIRVEQERTRARWQLWEQLEHQARDRAEWEARLASQLSGAAPRASQRTPEPDPDGPAGFTSSSTRKLGAARKST